MLDHIQQYDRSQRLILDRPWLLEVMHRHSQQPLLLPQFDRFRHHVESGDVVAKLRELQQIAG